jgi:hypothetical protein
LVRSSDLVSNLTPLRRGFRLGATPLVFEDQKRRPRLREVRGLGRGPRCFGGEPALISFGRELMAPQSYVVVCDDPAFVLQLVDRLYFTPIELQSDSRAAAILRNELHAVSFQRRADGSKVVGDRLPLPGFELCNCRARNSGSRGEQGLRPGESRACDQARSPRAARHWASVITGRVPRR